MNWLLGLLLSAAIAFIGYRKGALGGSGVVGAILVGTVIFGLGGWDWGLLLIAFFFSSSLLSRYREADKAAVAVKFSKGSRRDLGQTLANGGVGALLAMLFGLLNWPDVPWLAGYVGAIATVTADTWATEVGVLARKRPRMITTGRAVDAGTSGAVSGLGTAATLAGGLFIGLLAALLQLFLGASGGQGDAAGLILVGAIGGLVGSLNDSLLGATRQAIYYCDRCNKETEQRIHRCGADTRQIRGWRWLDNDLVNLISSAVGAMAALGLASWLG